MSDETKIESTEREAAPWDGYSAELGIGAPQTDAEKREADVIAALPHETRSSSESQEQLAEMREANTEAVREYRWDRQEELGREDERRGQIIYAGELVKKLWQAGIVCVLTRCNVAGIRSLKGDAETRRLRALYDRCMAGLVINSTRAMPLPSPRYVTWVQIPGMYEYSVMRFDAHGLPTREKYRGWRTVLIELIRQGFLTEREANRVFGEPSGAAARRWQELMQSIRVNQGIC